MVFVNREFKDWDASGDTDLLFKARYWMSSSKDKGTKMGALGHSDI